MNKIARLHYITQNLPHRSHAEQAKLACAGGTNWVQLRVKEKPYTEWLSIALKVQKICVAYNAKLIINDNVDLAKELNADGVHLGKTDLSPIKARTLLGPQAIIGGTANSLADVQHLLTQPIDYIGLGPYRYTITKQNLTPVLGLSMIEQINKSANQQLPIIAIGGITLDDVQTLMQSGIHGIAISSAINLSENPEETTQSFVQLLS